MNLTRSVVWLVIVPALLMLGTGCGGINASRSISPLNFLLPGLMHKGKPQDEVAPIAATPQVDQVQTVTVAQSL